jgi:hypothetical protein
MPFRMLESPTVKWKHYPQLFPPSAVFLILISADSIPAHFPALMTWQTNLAVKPHGRWFGIKKRSR